MGTLPFNTCHMPGSTSLEVEEFTFLDRNRLERARADKNS